MNTRATYYSLLLLIVLAIILGIVTYPLLPQMMISHWNAQGVPNGTMHKALGVFIFPIILIVFYVLFYGIPRLSPKKESFEQFKNHFNAFFVVLSLFIFYVFIVSLAWNLGVRFSFIHAFLPALAVLWFSIARLLGKTKQNWFVGIRTPWTLSNEVVWDKTHQLGKKLFRGLGGITLLGIVFPRYFFIGFFVSLCIVVATLFVYSYRQYKKISAQQ
jgi:uncharacterized membrane protein